MIMKWTKKSFLKYQKVDHDPFVLIQTAKNGSKSFSGFWIGFRIINLIGWFWTSLKWNCRLVTCLEVFTFERNNSIWNNLLFNILSRRNTVNWCQLKDHSQLTRHKHDSYRNMVHFPLSTNGFIMMSSVSSLIDKPTLSSVLSDPIRPGFESIIW